MSSNALRTLKEKCRFFYSTSIYLMTEKKYIKQEQQASVSDQPFLVGAVFTSSTGGNPFSVGLVD